MELSEEQVNRIVRKLNGFAAGHTGYVSEARLAWAVARHLPSFIQGAEGGSLDCGLIIGDDSLAGRSHTYNVLKGIRELGEKKVILGIDCKTLGPIICGRRRGGLYTYKVSRSEPQSQHAVLLAIHSILAPHLIALVPVRYLEKFAWRNASKGHLNPLEVPLSSAPLSPLPIELSPFVMPMKEASRGLKAVEDFASGKASYWLNPWNGIIFKSCLKPNLIEGKHLLASDANHIRDPNTIRPIWQAFETHPSEFAIEYPRMRPCIGDFYILHIPTNARAAVEIKHVGVRLSRRNGKLSLPTHGISKGRMFSYMSQWDFLLMVVESAGRAVLVSRDDLPLGLFGRYGAATHQRGEFPWPVTQSFLDKHTFLWPPTEQMQTFHSQMNGVLKDHVSRGNFNAQRSIPYVTPSIQDLESYNVLGPHHDVEDSDDFDEDTGEDSDAVRDQMQDEEDDGGVAGAEDDLGEGSASQPGWMKKYRTVDHHRGESKHRWSMLLYSNAEAEWLRAQCASSGYGTVFALSRHPSATHVFVPGPHRPRETFFDLPNNTPMIYLNFAHFAILNHRVPSDRRRKLVYLRATHGTTPSIYILRGWNDELKQHTPSRYFVPSETIATLKYVAQLQDILEYGKTNAKQTYENDYMFFSQLEPIDLYHIEHSDTLYHLRRLCEGQISAETVVTGNLRRGGGITITRDSYLVDKRGVMQEWEDLYSHVSIRRAGERRMPDDVDRQLYSGNLMDYWYANEVRRQKRREKEKGKATD